MPRRGQRKFSRPDIHLGVDSSTIFPTIVKQCNKGGHGCSTLKLHTTDENVIAGSVTALTPASSSCGSSTGSVAPLTPASNSCDSSTGSVAPLTPASNSCGSSTGSVAPSTPASNSHTMNMMTSSATRDLFYRHLEAEEICPKMAKTADRRDRTCWSPSQEADQIWDPG